VQGAAKWPKQVDILNLKKVLRPSSFKSLNQSKGSSISGRDFIISINYVQGGHCVHSPRRQNPSYATTDTVLCLTKDQ
jgi:hypothetical protein